MKGVIVLNRKAVSDKILILGIDGLDPRITRKLVDAGKMPNTKKFIERGAQREDLVMLGGVPTVTPPMWTTMATGAYPCTHGITCFTRQNKEDLDVIEYNLFSMYCKAEQLWNVFAEAGKKTLVWHWPGSSWPPSSQNPNLHVVDGTQPVGVNIGNSSVDREKVLVATDVTEGITYREKSVKDGKVPCVIKDLDDIDDSSTIRDKVFSLQIQNIILNYADGEAGISDMPFDVSLSTLTSAEGWADAPADAKEFFMLHSGGLIRRPCLLLKNDQGEYDRVAVYSSKKDTEPLHVLKNGAYYKYLADEAIRDDEKVKVFRNMRILEIREDGSFVKIWISEGMTADNDSLWHPVSLFSKVVDSVGNVPPVSLVGGSDKQLIEECMRATWDHAAEWTADALNHLIEKENFEVIFSHFHNVDLQGHMLVKYMGKGKEGGLSAEVYDELMEKVYLQSDEYIGRFMHLIDEGWTVFIISDHAAVSPAHHAPLICDPSGVNAGLMGELGFTVLKKDSEGNVMKEIDWSKTRAIQNRGNHLWLNIKGRNKHGIVDPADQYELEEEIMTALYGYKDPVTNRRVIALALRNKDAYLLGMGGPECGDILLWTAEGYNYDHCDSLSTTFGLSDTSVSPIIMCAGKGLKEGFTTDRIIRQVDLVPTVAVLGGVRMPAQCEGAPVYQILAEEF